MVLNWPYVNNIPFATNKPSVDQPDMKLNTESTFSLLAVDHFGFNANNGGTHQQVQIANSAGINGAIPGGLQGNGFETIYSSATAGNGELWFVRGASPTGIQLTGPGTPSVIANGYTFLPGGILLQWGSLTGVTGAGHVAGSKNFNTPFPNACFNVSATPIPINTGVTSTATIGIESISTTQFNWVYNKTTGASWTAFYWMAIGN